MEFDVALPWQIIKGIRSWFMSSIDCDCAKYGGTKRNFDVSSILLGIWAETRIDGDTLKIKKKGVNYNGGYILT